jgi:transcriptional regulator with GAF, ATPase, and Fis domain
VPLKLIVDEEGRHEVLALDGSPVRIGRAADNQIQLRNGRVSRHHCELQPEARGGWVVDLGSANGLLVNGERTRRAFLRLGDELHLGTARLVLETDEVPGEPAADGTGVELLRTLDGEADEATLRLRVFARILGALVRETDLPRLLRTIVDAGVELVAAERGFLVLDPTSTPLEGGETTAPGLRIQVARSFDRSDIPVPATRLSTGIARRVLEQGQALVSVDAGRDERFRGLASVDDLRLRSVLCVPVHDGQRTIGALYLDNRLQQGTFGAPEHELIALLADHAALAIRNARLVQQLLAKNRRLAESCAQIEALNQQLGRKVRDREEQLAVVRAELGRERGRHDYSGLVGSSDAMHRVFEQLDRLVDVQLPVLIQGESGTGKELVARAIHRNGARRDQPFISENCAALPDSLLESELFGHARGAFTGADRAKKGLLEQADGGTLFLDEIGDMSPEMQKKLLRVLQEGEVRPLGSDQRVKIDVRLLVASHRDLAAMVREGTFREDLYYRIHVLELQLPPLRERREDIPLLARELLARAGRELGRPVPLLTHEVLAALSSHSWPGNVRELENEMRRLLVLAEDVVRLEHLSPRIGQDPVNSRSTAPADPVPSDLRGAVANYERGAILEALERNQGNKSRAAAELGISRFALQRKLDKFGLGAPGADETEPGTAAAAGGEPPEEAAEGSAAGGDRPS